MTVFRNSPQRPEPGTIVVFVQGESEFTWENRQEMTIEQADHLASFITNEDTHMRLDEDVYVSGSVPHTMRGYFLWIESSHIS